MLVTDEHILSTTSTVIKSRSTTKRLG